MKFQEVYEAYEILKEDQKRATYDFLYSQSIKEQYTQQATAQSEYKSSSSHSNTKADAYGDWQEEAKAKAAYYSKVGYKDFLKGALKIGTNVISFVGQGILVLVYGAFLWVCVVVLTIIEFGIAVLLGLGVPILSFSFSPIWGGLSLIVGLFCAYH